MMKFLIILIVLLLVSCKSAPDVDPCVVFVKENVLLCSSKKGNYEVKFSKADKYICMHPDDTRDLLEYIKRGLD